jgi:hypothetical protein
MTLPLRLWICTRCAASPEIPGLDICTLIRRDPPDEGCPCSDLDGAAWRAVNSVQFEPATLTDIACQLAELAAGLIAEAHKGHEDRRAVPEAEGE